MNDKKFIIGSIVGLVIIGVITFHGLSYLWGVSHWQATDDMLRENIVVEIPELDNATHAEAWIKSANPYVYWNIAETNGIVVLPATITFETSWDNATLHVVYYEYRSDVTGVFDDSKFTQEQYYKIGGGEYWLDLTQLD